MSEREALEQKSFSDLVTIAETFNIFTREEAEKKTAAELVNAIAGPAPEEPKKKTTKKAKDVAAPEKKAKTASKKPKKEEKPAEVKNETIEAAAPEVKEEPKKAPKKSTKTTKKTKATEVAAETPAEVQIEAPVETATVAVNEATGKSEIKVVKAVKKETKPAKKTKKSTKAEAKEEAKEVLSEEKPVEENKTEVEPVSEESKTEEKKPVKKTTRSKKKPSKGTSADDKTEVKAEEASTSEPASEPVVETAGPASGEATEVASETSNEQPDSKKKKNNRRGSKNKKTDKKTESDKKEEKPSAETSEETSKEGSEPAKEDNASEKTEQKNNQNPNQNRKNKKPVRGKRRTLSFGAQENGEVVVTEIAQSEVPATDATPAEGEEVQPEPPKEPEIQYIEVEGVLSIGSGDKGDFNGFIHRNNYLPGDEDAFVQGQLIRKLGLRRGDYIKGLAIAPRGKEKYAPLKKILSVNGIEMTEDMDLDIIKKRKRFESLTAIYPDEKLKLETNFGGSKNDLSTRIIDLFSPIGKGQRGMIVSPPKAGKTVLLKKVANAITANNPNCKLIVLLIDERPEEVTDMQRSIQGEVVYSTFDKKPENHVRVTELVLERAMRLVELGEDVVILLDSMTRLARAYNLTINPTGRTLSGGLDPGSLYGPKRFFGAARNIENGGSLTIIATALIETGSRMDEVIFEEFKGTGNMEVTLDRKLADRRVFPAIAVDKSGTRREDLLLTPEELEAIWLLRKRIADVDTVAATDAVINFMQKTTSNNSFVLSIKKSFSVDG